MTLTMLSTTEGDSFLDRLNPLAKLAWVGAVVIVAFSTANALLLAALGSAGLVCAAASGKFAPVIRGCMLLVPVGASLLFLQSVAPAIAEPWTAVASLGPFTIYQEGMYWGLVLFGRVFAVLVAGLLLTSSTQASDLFAALAKAGVPHNFNFMLSMTLQLVPIFQRELSVVLSAQKSRGMKAQGFSALIPSFIPVFIGAIERVQQLAISLESRGYGSQGPKTTYRRSEIRRADRVAIGAAGLFCLAMVALTILKRGWNLRAQFSIDGGLALGIVAFAMTAFLVVLVAVYAASRKI
ncbi:MAG TPA: energy-coupling factor transporter transmembrane component T [Cellulomonas sp.]